MKLLIVNADDFGRSAGINRGIVEAHRHGIVTSATLMVNYPAAVEAAALSQENPGLGVGLHFALTGGVTTLPASSLPSLVDVAGRLPAKPEGLGAARFCEVLAEGRAQLRRFEELMGRRPTHFDSHHHSHRLAVVLEALVALAVETGLPVRTASPEMGERLRALGVKTTEAFIESFFDAGATREVLLSILDALGEGSAEIMCHPAYVDDELRSTSGYADARERERAVLTSPGLRQEVAARGLRLATFADL
jgi:chitin disaccharide deacetylase